MRVTSLAAPDAAVQATTDDATTSKQSAANLGYFADPYLAAFVRQPVRRAPVINRGYFARVAALRSILARFFTLWPHGQLVNIGAGLDTIFFWLSDLQPRAVHFEIDFAEVLAKKTALLARNPQLVAKVVAAGGGSPADGAASLETCGGSHVRSEKLRMVAADIRNIAEVDRELRAAGYDPSAPTLFLAECVLIYLRPDESDPVVQWAAKLSDAPSCFVTYEQVNPADPFGKMMVQNLAARGCPLLGIHRYPSLDAQVQRYRAAGWAACSILDMNGVYDTYLPADERRRAEGCELFDELEEWRLFQGHYFISVATSNAWRSPAAAAHHFLSQGDAGGSLPPQT